MIAYLREIFESGKSDNGAGVTVNYCYREIGCLNKFKNFRVRVNAVVNVVLPDFNQVNDSISVVGVGSSEDNTVLVKVKLFLLMTLTSSAAWCASTITTVSSLHLIFYTFHLILLNTT